MTGTKIECLMLNVQAMGLSEESDKSTIFNKESMDEHIVTIRDKWFLGRRTNLESTL